MVVRMKRNGWQTGTGRAAAGWFYSRIVATSVLGEVLHCKGELTRSLALMQQTEQMARQHDVWHYALWSLIQQSEILFAKGFLQTAWETQEKAFQLINEQHLEQLPIMSFWCAFVRSCCGPGTAG